MAIRAVYLDSCCFIELAKAKAGAKLERGGAYVWPLETLIRAGRDSAIRVVTSLVTLAECLHADGNFDENVQRLFRSMLTSGRSGVVPYQPDIFVMERARDLRWKHKINMHPMDMIHVATAIESRCDEFITWDGVMKPKSPIGNAMAIAALGLQVRTPNATMLIPDSYKQHTLGIHVKDDDSKETHPGH